MKADVLLYPQAVGHQLFQDKLVVVIDAFRATSTIVTALAHGAIEVIPVNEPMEAIELIRSIGKEECVIGGEQKGFKIEGFDLGNSPVEYTEPIVSGKKVVLCTTNGTKAIKRAQGADAVLIGSFLNLQAIVEWVKESARDILFVCAGSEGRVSLEDLTCAGMMIEGLKAVRPEVELSDAAQVALLVAGQARPDLTAFLRKAEHGAYLIQNRMETDVVECTRLNTFAIVPAYGDGKVVIGQRMSLIES